MICNNGVYKISITEQPWDSEMLQVKCGYLAIELYNASSQPDFTLSRLLSDALDEAKQLKFEFITAKIRTTKQEEINACKNNKGKLVDTEVTFHKNRCMESATKPFYDRYIVLKYIKYWHDSLYNMASMFKFSRFYVDDRISGSRAERLWKASIFNSCNGRASYSIICCENQRPVGLMNVFEKGNTSDIFLIAVLPEYQGKGVGKAMVQYYEDHLDNDIEILTVDTQKANLDAKRFYSKLGYRVWYMKNIFHFWL